ncbi:MAG: tRNA pseudouridine(38-40) synthase TruA [Rhabdochlamydiaceae bacterium]
MNVLHLKYKLLIAYDGTRYGGWQIQPTSTSIQAVIEAALKIALRKETPIISSGRTDAGVHARGQVAHFEAPPVDLALLYRSLNGLLPEDIRIRHIENVPQSVHARYSALSKEYHYHIHLDWALDPFKRHYAYHHPYPLDLNLMEKASLSFLGTRDFTSFANQASKGSAAKNPIRTITRLQIIPESGGFRLEFEGDGFLYKMVRNITGTLLDVGRKKLTPEEIPALFEKKDRRQISSVAPPQGLFLIKVNYP